MAEVTITLDDQDLARARALAQAEGLSVEEWLRVRGRNATVARRAARITHMSEAQ
jgi:hypothetical protein